MLLACALLALAALLSWEHWAAHRQTETVKRARLPVRERAVKENLRSQLAAAYAVLQTLRDALAGVPVDRWAANVAPRLETLAAAMPGAHPIDVSDARWRVLANNQPGLPGSGVAATPAFVRVAARPNAAVLYLSPP